MGDRGAGDAKCEVGVMAHQDQTNQPGLTRLFRALFAASQLTPAALANSLTVISPSSTLAAISHGL